MPVVVAPPEPRRNAGGRNGSAYPPPGQKRERNPFRRGLTEYPAEYLSPQLSSVEGTNDTHTHRPAEAYSRAYAPRGAAARSRRRKHTAGVRRGCICCCCARRRPRLSAAERRAGGRTAQMTLARERRAAGAGHAGRSDQRRVRARPGGGGGDSRALGPQGVRAHALRRPKAARWMRAACALRRGRGKERWGGGRMCGWPARGARCGRVGCVALLCFLGQRELSSTSPLQRLPLPYRARVRRRPARARLALFSSAGQLA